jgi:hypothetical protein
MKLIARKDLGMQISTSAGYRVLLNTAADFMLSAGSSI